MIPKINRELKCVLSLSLSFMILFGADFTMTNMQKVVVSSIADDNPGFAVEGYTVVGVMYSVFALSLWFGPYITYKIGPKITMALSALAYFCFVSSYAVETEWAIYAGAIISGVGAGTLWPAQGQYLIQNSSPEKTSRNVGIFFFLLTSSFMLGNIFVFFTFRDQKYIHQSTRRTTIYILMAINALAVVAFLLLPKTTYTNNQNDVGPIKTIKKSWSILTSSKMLWLILTFSYAGLQQSFWNGIYSPSIGFTLGFGDSVKQLVALSGIFISIGGIMGAACPILLSGWVRSHHYARKMIVLIGAVAQICTYFIAYINLPDSAVFGNTEEISLIQPSTVLAMLGSLLLTFGDNCLNTQVYSFVGEYYRENSAEACALYKFVKGVFVAVSFFGSSHLGLHTQVAIMAVMAVVSVAAFFVADWDDMSQPPTKQDIVTVTHKES